MWELIINNFRDYIGSGVIFIIYLCALVYLLVTEKRKERRIFFIYMPLAVFVIFFNPFSARFFADSTDEKIYFRILWLLPVTVTLADCFTEIFLKVKGKMKIVVLAAEVLLIVLGGRLMYLDEKRLDNHYEAAENVYHVPQTVVDICDSIIVPGREIIAAFPRELFIYVRQYTPYVVMPYGWDDVKKSGYDTTIPLRRYIENGGASAELLSSLGHEAGCHYLVVPDENKPEGDMAAFGFTEFENIGGYTIYKSEIQYFGLWDEE